MSYICFNPKCKHHTPLPEHMEHIPELKVPNGQDAEYKSLYGMTGMVEQMVVTKAPYDIIQRHRYQTAWGDEYYLCEICHSAVQYGDSIVNWNKSHSPK